MQNSILLWQRYYFWTVTGIGLLHLPSKDYIYFCGNVIGYESGSHPAGKAAGTKEFPLLKPRQPSYSLPSRPLPFNSCLLSVPQGQQTKPLRKLCYFWTHTSLLWQVSYFMAILLPIRRGTERKRKEQFFSQPFAFACPWFATKGTNEELFILNRWWLLEISSF